jgi:hypothetical protein
LIFIEIAAGLYIARWLFEVFESGLREHRETDQWAKNHPFPDLKITPEEIEQAHERRRKEACH